MAKDPRDTKDAKGGLPPIGSPEDLIPGKGRNMSNAEASNWMDELARRKRSGQPMDKPPGFYNA